MRVSGAKGRAPTEFYKASLTYVGGFKMSGMLFIAGRNAVSKAKALAGTKKFTKFLTLKISSNFETENS